MQNIEEAVDKIFKRDYSNEGYQTFVPPEFIPSRQLIRLFENKSSDKMEERLEALSVTEDERERMRGLRDAAEGEKVERDLYEALREYFNQYKEQEILVIYSYHFAKKVRAAAHAEKERLHHCKQDIRIHYEY